MVTKMVMHALATKDNLEENVQHDVRRGQTVKEREMTTHGHLRENRISSVLEVLQYLTICTILLVAPTTHRHVLGEDPEWQRYIPVEFRGVVLFLPDYVMGMLLVLTLIRLSANRCYREQLQTTVNQVTSQNKGRVVDDAGGMDGSQPVVGE